MWGNALLWALLAVAWWFARAFFSARGELLRLRKQSEFLVSSLSRDLRIAHHQVRVLKRRIAEYRAQRQHPPKH
jgi:hypothetical protein